MGFSLNTKVYKPSKNPLVTPVSFTITKLADTAKKTATLTCCEPEEGYDDVEKSFRVEEITRADLLTNWRVATEVKQEVSTKPAISNELLRPHACMRVP